MSSLIRAARAQKFTIQIRGALGEQPRKIAKLIFSESDGSLFLDFPYFESTDGLAAVATLRSGANDIDLTDGGKVTSHLVKYAHHRDGEVHFSQTGKVYTAVRKRSVPLNQHPGHLFTIQIQGLAAFKEATGPDYAPENHKDQPITFNLFGQGPRASKILGFWYTKRSLRQRVTGSEAGPGITLLHAQAPPRHGVIVSTPEGCPGSASFLILTASSIPPMTIEPGGHLTFVGGFDRHEVIYDHTKPTRFLALSYPAADLEQLRSKLGSIDLGRDEQIDRLS